MNHQRLLFEYSPFFLVVCLATGIGYAFILYKAKHSWTPAVNRLLFAFRTVLVFIIALLLLGPTVKLTQNHTEKPEFVFLNDNSLSVKDAVDSIHRQQIKTSLSVLAEKLKNQGYAISFRNLAGEEQPEVNTTSSSSDLSGALRETSDSYEGKNLAGIILISDGIYNSGSSPLYTPLRVPVLTIGEGDTSQRKDLVLKNLEFNKIAYQGNKFPLRVQVLVDEFPNQEILITVSQAGKVVSHQSKNSGTKQLLEFDFQLDAKDKGLQRVDVVIEPVAAEKNIRNNRATAFVEVVEGKKKILLIAPAPHPDIKALRAVVEKNANYEFILHIPGVQEAEPSLLQPGKADLVIFHQVLDLQGKTTALFSKFSKGSSSLLLIAGMASNLRAFQSSDIPLNFEKSGQWDEATPVINPSFRDFGFSENINLAFSKYPPARVPFGKFSFARDASVLLYQQIGSVPTDRPMLMTLENNGRKTGILIGENIGRWRMNEFSENEKTEAFDEVFGKLIQYLSTQDDKRKFRVFPVQHEFSDAEPVQFESQIYNDLFQQIYGNTISIDLRDEQGKLTSYNYVTSKDATRYLIGGLKEGVYKYTGSALVNGRKEEMKGEFLVRAQNIESQNLMADFTLLRKLSEATGGQFHPSSEIVQLEDDIKSIKAKGLIHSEETYNPLINLPWVFFTLLLLVSTEWFLRKFLGAY